jgi:hypothetical protein
MKTVVTLEQPADGLILTAVYGGKDGKDDRKD